MRNKPKTGPKQRKPQLKSESIDSKITAFLNWASSCHAQHAGLTTQIKRVDTALAFSTDIPGSVSYSVVFGAVPDGSSSRPNILKLKDTGKKSETECDFFSVAVNVLASIFYARRVTATGNNFPLFRWWLVFARRVNTSPAQLYQMGWRCFPTTDIFLTICMSVSSSHDTSTRPTAFGKQFNDLQHATCNIKYHQEEGIQQDKSGILPRMNGVRWDVKYMVG